MASTDFYAAVIDALVTPPPGTPASVHQQAIAGAAEFAAGQIDALAPELRWAMKIGLAGFSGVVAISHFRRFTRLPAPVRAGIIRTWAFGPFALTRQLFRPIRSTALVAYYEAISLAGER